MSDDKCKCTLRESMLGDGCRVCQPRTYIAHLEDALKLAEGEIAQLEAELADAQKDQARYQTMRKAIVNCDRKVEEILLQNLTDAGGNDEFDAAVDLAIKEQQ